MSTEIYFAGENLRVRVDENPNQVAEAFASADGRPFRLTREGGQGDVYINPAAVACWSVPEPTPEPDPDQDGPQAGPDRRAVTDIWGQPLRRKRRRG